jgi:hypothetical protein
MKRTLCAGIAVLAAACGGGNTAERSRNTTGTGAQGLQAAVTVTGCLRASEQPGGPVGTSGSSGASIPQFTIAADARSGPGSAIAGTTGSSTTTIDSVYMLEGDAAELRQHVNQQVQISGHLDTAGGATGDGGGTPMGSGASRSAATAHGGGGSPSGSTISGSRSLNGAQRLRVESVQLLAVTCPVH